MNSEKFVSALKSGFYEDIDLSVKDYVKIVLFRISLDLYVMKTSLKSLNKFQAQVQQEYQSMCKRSTSM